MKASIFWVFVWPECDLAALAHSCSRNPWPRPGPGRPPGSSPSVILPQPQACAIASPNYSFLNIFPYNDSLFYLPTWLSFKMKLMSPLTVKNQHHWPQMIRKWKSKGLFFSFTGYCYLKKSLNLKPAISEKQAWDRCLRKPNTKSDFAPD